MRRFMRTRLEKLRILNRFVLSVFWLAFFLLLGLVFTNQVAHAQQDITISGINPYTVIGRNLVWGASGPGGVNNNFIFTPPSTDSAVCVYFTNKNPTNAHTVNLVVDQ